MATLWKRGGKLLKASGNLIDCAECPCFEAFEETDCTNCCGSTTPFAQYSLDLGSAGFRTDDHCSTAFCDAIGGTYVLDQDGSCEWNYTETDPTCSVTTTACNAACPDPPWHREYYQLTMHQVTATKCEWRCLCKLAAGPMVDPCYGGEQGANCIADRVDWATYTSTRFLIADEKCRIMPVTLTKTDEDVSGVLCAGNWPSTIEIDEVV